VQVEYPTDFDTDASTFVVDALIESDSGLELSAKLLQL
jgi:hypothetical protein